MTDVVVHAATPREQSVLGLFLYHRDPTQKDEAERAALEVGGERVTFPVGRRPKPAVGHVGLKGSRMHISIGALYLTAPSPVQVADIADLDGAVVYLVDEPFDAFDQTEKNWIAANVPIILNEEEA